MTTTRTMTKTTRTLVIRKSCRLVSPHSKFFQEIDIVQRCNGGIVQRRYSGIFRFVQKTIEVLCGSNRCKQRGTGQKRSQQTEHQL